MAQEKPKHSQNHEEDLTYGDIVWGQFKKNPIAYYSLWALIILFLLAICAPVIASGRPFIWTENGVTSYPWFGSLFDLRYYENGVDIFFNLLLVLGLPLFGLWYLRMKMLRKTMTKRPRRQKLKVEAFALFGLFLVSFAVVMTVATKKKPVQYYDTFQQHQLQQEPEALQAAFEQQSNDKEALTDTQLNLLRLAKRLNVGTPEKLTDAQRSAESKELSATFAPIPYSFKKTGFDTRISPNAKHWLGIDSSGRDVAVRMLYGTRISLSIGVIAVGIYVTIGIIVGAIAGFFGGRIDMIIQRIIEIFMCVPTLIVLLVLIAFLPPSIYYIMLVIGLFRWTGVARLVRGEFYRLRNLDFVTSAIALGYPTRRIIFKHILPNALGPVLVAATFGVAAAILMESSLSFLGIGDVSIPSWGQTLKDGTDTQKWHLILAPGFAIFLTVSLLNLVGEGLRDALDPKMRK